jgi:hypothetical protein
MGTGLINEEKDVLPLPGIISFLMHFDAAETFSYTINILTTIYCCVHSDISSVRVSLWF